MKIAADTVASIEYTLRDDAGEVLDKSGAEPLAYLHGHDNIVPGLESALEGKEAGASLTAEVAPDEGYGPRHEGRVMKVPREQLPSQLDPKVGMVLQAQADNGQVVPVWITEVADEAITVDGNHPLAGKALHFEVTVKEVRAATEEELEHGHVHGPGGHHH